MFGVCFQSAQATIVWANPVARRAVGGSGDGDGVGFDALLDVFGVRMEDRQGLWRAMAEDRSFGSDEAPGRASAAVAALAPDRAAGPGRFVLTLARPSPLVGGGGNLLESQSTRDTMRLLVGALDAMSAEVAIVDSKGVILAVNRAWREFARLNDFQDENAGVGSNYLSACDNARGQALDEARAIAAGLRAVLAGQQMATYVEYPCDSPEEQRWFQVRASGFDWDGSRFAVVSHESLTEAKRAEQQHREQLDEMAHQWRMSSLGELASGIAHELNQPLGAITNYMNGCLRRLESGTIDRAQLIKTVRGCAELAEFAGGIIKRMRGFASHSKCQYQPISLNDAVSKALQFFNASPKRGRVRVTLDLADDLPRVRADEVQIQQVALNLVRNAADSVLACGRVPAVVRVGTFLDGEGMVCLAVADNGHGLPDGAEGRLFEPFFSTKNKGMGLGLSISKTIAEVHGGRLTARNVDDGEGAVFELKLPPLSRAADPGDGRAADRSATSVPNTLRCKSQGGAA